MELSGDLPPFPSPHEPATHGMLEELLRAIARDLAMAVCLLQELHNKDSLKCLLLEPKSDADGKMVKKLLFCPFCLYNGSNDISYMNHIMSRHYSAVYSCGKCLKEVFLLSQQLKMHLKACTGFPKGGTPSSSDKEPMQQGAQESLYCSQCPKKKLDSTKESSSHSKAHKSHKKSKHQKEGTPKKEKRSRTRKTNTSLKSPSKSRPLPSAHFCSPSSQSNACQKWHGQHPGSVVFSHSFDRLLPLSIFHYSCTFL